MLENNKGITIIQQPTIKPSTLKKKGEIKLRDKS